VVLAIILPYLAPICRSACGNQCLGATEKDYSKAATPHFALQSAPWQTRNGGDLAGLIDEPNAPANPPFGA
jgi:hypothetical protein